MKNEADFKVLIKKSIRAAKGFSLSLAAPMLSGIPDLYVVLPGYLPVLLEAKWLGEINKEKFSRKPRFSPLQIVWIGECDKVVPYSAMGLMGFYYNGLLHAALVRYGTSEFSQFSNSFLTNCSYVVKSDVSKLFDMQQLFAGVPIPRITPTITMRHEDIGYGAQYNLAL